MNLVVTVLVKPTIILSLALLLSMIWRRAAASTRYAIGALALLSALVLPIAELALPKIDLPLMSATPSSSAMTPSSIPSFERSGEQGAFAGSPGASDIDLGKPAAALPSPHNRIMEILAMVWFIGFAAVVYRLLSGVRAARRLAKNSITPGADSEQLLAELRSQLSMTQSVRVAIANGALSPVGWGLRTSVIVLPAQSSQWSANLRRAVLTHELAHVKRHDLLLQLVIQGACAVHWFNPLFWYMASRLRIQREIACDDYVLNFGAGSADYAASLLQIARAGIADRLSGAAMAMAHGSHLETRLRSIMDTNRNRKALSAVSHASLLCGTGLLTFAIAAVQITALPVIPSPRLLAGVPPIEFRGSTPAEGLHSVMPRVRLQVPAQTPLPGSGATAVESPTAFETASVKEVNPDLPSSASTPACGGTVTLDPKYFSAESITAYGLIGLAYGSSLLDTVCLTLNRYNLITGGPAWMRFNRFDIHALIPDGSTSYTKQQLSMGEAPKLEAMIRTLLADRFKLVLHHETREMPVYELTVEKSGFKLQELKEGSCIPGSLVPVPPLNAPDLCPDCGSFGSSAPLVEKCGVGIIQLKSGLKSWRKDGSFENLSEALEVMLDRPVIDKTGIKGRFDIRLSFLDEGPVFDVGIHSSIPLDPGIPTIFEALHDLGLKLEAGKGTVDVLAVDHIEMPKPD